MKKEIVIDRNDNKQQAKRFKKATKNLFKYLEEEYHLNIENIKYGNGYFIFYHGDNSVVHFKVKQAPGWLFGLWWSLPKDYEDHQTHEKKTPLYIEGQLFAQYEDNIDKFKPSNSLNLIEITARPEEKDGDSEGWYAYSLIKFIINEPALAFCKDEYCWNYNREYHSRREAKRKFKAFKHTEKLKQKLTPKYDLKVLKRIVKDFEEEFNEDTFCFIDRGENWSPRYEIIARMSSFDLINEPGSYTLYLEEDEEDQALETATRKYINKIDKKANKKFYWFNPTSFFIEIMKDKDYDKLKKQCGVKL